MEGYPVVSCLDIKGLEDEERRSKAGEENDPDTFHMVASREFKKETINQLKKQRTPEIENMAEASSSTKVKIEPLHGAGNYATWSIFI